MVEPRERPIALVGLMGAGKSAVARLLGERLAVALADLDAMVEAEAGCTIAELFDREGEPAFRRRERRLLERALAAGARIVACGGGIVLDREARETLKARCWTVWLEVAPAEAARRIAAGRALRPLLKDHDPAARLAALERERAPLYAEVAAARIATDGSTPAQVAEAVLRARTGLAA